MFLDECKKYSHYVAASGALLLAACGGGSGSGSGSGDVPAPIVKPVEFAAKVASCSNDDRPETALQGQVPAAQREAGFTGTNCNLKLVGQYQGEGGGWSTATFRDSQGHACAYHATLNAGALKDPSIRKHPGVPVIDITDSANPVYVTSLATEGMLDPWEGLRVHQGRGLLIAARGNKGTSGNGGPEIDVYDLSADCRHPQLLASVAQEYKTGDVNAPTKSMSGHEGNLSPDGMTYYVGNTTDQKYHAIDISVPSRPRLIATFDMKNSPIGQQAHGLSVSPDGNRVYGVALARLTPAEVADPNAKPKNGFLVLDTSEVQARKPNPEIRLISSTAYKDGSTAQHTIETKIGGKPYLVVVDEGGSGGLSSPETVQNACNSGLAPFPMARIYDLVDEKNPKLVSKLGLETHDVKNCDSVIPDITGIFPFSYGSHYCSVDSRENATAMAWSYFNSGIRVFDIRDPAHPKEIAYFNPPGVMEALPGSPNAIFPGWKPGRPDWCTSRLDFDKANGMLTTMCQDNGLLTMKFENGVWPFPESVASTLQN